MGRRKDELTKLADVDFFGLAKKESNARARIRFLALGHLQLGGAKTEVASMFQVSLNALRKWMLRFLDGRCRWTEGTIG